MRRKPEGEGQDHEDIDLSDLSGEMTSGESEVQKIIDSRAVAAFTKLGFNIKDKVKLVD